MHSRSWVSCVLLQPEYQLGETSSLVNTAGDLSIFHPSWRSINYFLQLGCGITPSTSWLMHSFNTVLHIKQHYQHIWVFVSGYAHSCFTCSLVFTRPKLFLCFYDFLTQIVSRNFFVWHLIRTREQDHAVNVQCYQTMCCKKLWNTFRNLSHRLPLFTVQVKCWSAYSSRMKRFQWL